MEEFKVTFVRLNETGDEDSDTEFTALCTIMPRVDESVLVPGSGKANLRVQAIRHTLVRNEENGPIRQYITVVIDEDVEG